MRSSAHVRFTERLRLEPIAQRHAEDLWKLHQDAGVAEWYGGRWSRDKARRRATQYARAWETDGVHKWMAYDRSTDQLIGRGGLSRSDVDGERRLEVGWALFEAFWGRGYATEIGRASLEFAFTSLEESEVVAFTEKHNHQSRAVMERLGMTYIRDFVSSGLVEGLEGEHENATFVLYAIRRAG